MRLGRGSGQVRYGDIGVQEGGGKLSALFYADDVLLASPWLDRQKEALDIHRAA